MKNKKQRNLNIHRLSKDAANCIYAAVKAGEFVRDRGLQYQQMQSLMERFWKPASSGIKPMPRLSTDQMQVAYAIAVDLSRHTRLP